MRAASENGTPLPRAFRDGPVLDDGYQANIYVAFWALSSCRALGMSVGPIPWVAIDAYARKHEFDCDSQSYDAFVFLIQDMDSVFMKHAANQQKQSAGK
jgi:hypothetical protein